jgi:hypothetical protein
MENQNEENRSNKKDENSSPYEELYGKAGETKDSNEAASPEGAGDFGSATNPPGPESVEVELPAGEAQQHNPLTEPENGAVENDDDEEVKKP